MSSVPPQQCLVALDVEGVLTPEIWIAVADEFGIEGLKRTTKDEPNYQLLMDSRIQLINSNGIALQDIQSVRSFQELNYRVLAAGDSYNDLSMIDQADAGLLFRAPDHVRSERSDLVCHDDYSDLLNSIQSFIESSN